MPRTEIISTGRCVPDRVITNRDLEKMMDTSDEWIQQRTGIIERRWVPEGQETGGSDLAKIATERALEKAGMDVGEIDAIILATLSPDHMFPGTACFLQAKLGLKGIPALDVRNQCSGFLYGLSLADAWIRTGAYRRVLLVGSEIHSTGLNLSTAGRDVSVIFGDGAAVAILGPTNDPDRGLLAINLGADGRYARELWVDAPGSIYHPQCDPRHIAEGRHYPRMEGSKVFKHAIVRMPGAVRGALDELGMSPEEIDLLIAHQANLRICEAVQQSLGLRDDQVFNNIQRYGNTTAATIPLALDEAIEQGRIERGGVLAFTAFGAGFSWGASIMRF